jgi:hypothetical protein
MSFSVNISLTGDCQSTNVGAATLVAVNDPFLTTPPFFYDWVLPNIGTGDTQTGLSAGTYVVRVNDSTSPTNLETYVNVNISSGICSHIVSVVDTSCGFDNGILNITAGTIGQEITYYLYSGDTLYLTQASFGYTSFVDLPAGIYSIVSVDSGGCSATTQTCIVLN